MYKDYIQIGIQEVDNGFQLHVSLGIASRNLIMGSWEDINAWMKGEREDVLNDLRMENKQFQAERNQLSKCEPDYPMGHPLR